MKEDVIKKKTDTGDVKMSSELIGDIAGDTVGALVTTGLGYAVGGPIGSLLGAPIGPIIKTVVGDMLSRSLSQKEKNRIISVTEITKRKIAENISSGKTIRDDGFFSSEIGSTGEEIYEGILLVSQKEYEERKLELIGRMYGNIAFDKSITRQIANSLVKLVSDLTYRELKILKLVGIFQKAAASGIDPRIKKAAGYVKGLTNVSIASSVYSLYIRSLLHSPEFILDAGGINPSLLSLMGNGSLLFQLMELENTAIDEDEEEVTRFLTGERFIGIYKQGEKRTDVL